MIKNKKAKILELGTALKAGEVFASGVSLQQKLDAVVKIISDASGSKICAIMFHNQKENKLSVKASYGLNKDIFNEIDMELGPKPVEINVLHDNKFLNREIAEKEELRSMIAVPVLMEDKVAGVLCLYDAPVRKITESEITILQIIGNQAIMAAENANLLKRALDAEEALESRKLIERAKGILMKTQGMDEDDAYRTIHRKSMDIRRSMKEIAEAIILSNEIRIK
ncbi:MAG: hypothetical protein A3J83_02335 [Elusimicrobia bacterium RIFOXYA2_FULL_40_6]|nr:MAG: hypothetical protein A3J83_02335 [Elusimicrobia bacterium RIFOXYA2_FULL_40_6]